MAPTTRRGECSAYSSQFNHKLAEVWGCDGPKCSKDEFVCNGRHLQENLLKSLLASSFFHLCVRRFHWSCNKHTLSRVRTWRGCMRGHKVGGSKCAASVRLVYCSIHQSRLRGCNTPLSFLACLTACSRLLTHES